MNFKPNSTNTIVDSGELIGPVDLDQLKLRKFMQSSSHSSCEVFKPKPH